MRYKWILFVAATILCACNGVTESDIAHATKCNDIEPEIERQYGVPTEGYVIERTKVKNGETMGHIMGSHGRTALEIDRIDRATREVFPLKNIRAGQPYSLFIKRDSLGNEQVDYIAYERNKIDYVLFTMREDSTAVSLGQKPTKIVRNKRCAVIQSSLWGAVMEERLPYSLASQLEDVYQWSVDFFGIQPNDKFTVIYDEMFVDDSVSVGIGQLWGAKFTQSGKDYYAVPFQQKAGRTEFWDETGGSLRKHMLKAPLKYSRVSSRFSNARLHPIYKVYRPHHGVDYAAPMGTPVHSVADGVVTFKGWGGGGGNTLKIKHPNDIMTGYLHLSRYASGIVTGSRVKQGDLIGYVGSTGASTGPHLDYRVWRHGVAIDPLKIPQKPSEPISESNRAEFDKLRDRIIAELEGDVAESDRVTSIERPKSQVDSLKTKVVAHNFE